MGVYSGLAGRAKLYLKGQLLQIDKQQLSQDGPFFVQESVGS